MRSGLISEVWDNGPYLQRVSLGLPFYRCYQGSKKKKKRENIHSCPENVHHNIKSTATYWPHRVMRSAWIKGREMNVPSNGRAAEAHGTGHGNRGSDKDPFWHQYTPVNDDSAQSFWNTPCERARRGSMSGEQIPLAGVYEECGSQVLNVQLVLCFRIVSIIYLQIWPGYAITP